MTFRARLKAALPGPLRRLWARRSFWRDYWFTGEWELRELSRLVDRRRGAVDVGGNTGVYLYHLSRLAAWVRAFEPNPDLARDLANLKRRNVAIETVALSGAPGHAELRIPFRDSGREDVGMASLESAAVSADKLARVVPVEMRTLDSYGLANLGFIKIDVEGHEEAVLAGAIETIRANRPVLLIEIEERHNLGGLSRIAERLAGLDYDGFFFEGGRQRPLADFDAAVHQQVSAALEQHGSRRSLAYINNFLFQPRRV